MITLNSDNLQDIVKQNPRTLVLYGASWCGNCRMIKPKFSKLAEQHQDITFVYVDAETYPNSRKMAQVNNLPTFGLFSQGELLQQKQGNKIELVEEMIHEATHH